MMYFDNNATTAIDPAVFEAMRPFLTDYFANPSSPYGAGRRVARALWEAREKVADLVGAVPPQVIFTSGGTEANNTALRMAVQANPGRRRILVSSVEHASVRASARALRDAYGFELVEIPVDRDGGLRHEVLDAELDDRVALVSVMMANNETGVLFPIEAIAARAREQGVIVHCDAVQAAGKIPLNFAASGVHLMSVSSHKLHGPKGIGALLADGDLPFSPLVLGGGQESGRRGGTENVASIVGFGEAALRVDLSSMGARVRALRDRFESSLLEGISGSRVNGGSRPRLPQTANLVFPGIEAEALISLLDLEEIFCSTGSACAAGSPEPSHVLAAMGASRSEMRASVRFGLSRFTTNAETDTVLDCVLRFVNHLRAG